MIIINGKEEAEAEGMTVGDYLEKIGFSRIFIAVERNGQIVPKTEYDKMVLQDSDKVEIVRFVGGG